MDQDAMLGLQPRVSSAYLAQDKSTTIVVTTTTVSALSTVFVAARMFTRQFIMGRMHLDDYLVISAVPFQWACVALAIMAVQNGNGKHFDTLSLEQKEGSIFWTIIGFPFGIMAFGLPKLAVVALLQRLMNPKRWHSIFLWAVSSLCVAILLGCVVILFAQCSPADSQWDFSITDKTCISPWVLVDYAIFAGGFSAVVDLYLAIYPAFVLWSLQIHIRKKIALCAALGIGSVATVVAIYKCTRLPSLASADFSYNTSDLVIWTIIEGSTIIIACCIPVLQPLIDLIFGRRTMSGSGSYNNYGSSRSRPLRSTDIELDKTDGTAAARRNARLAMQKDMSSSSRVGDPEVDSQDSILREDREYGGGDSGKGAGAGAVLEGRKASVGGNRIVRTDVVTISYDRNDGHGADEREDPNTSWARI